MIFEVKEPLDKYLTFRMTSSEINILRKIAKKHGITHPDYARQIIRKRISDELSERKTRTD